MKDYAEKLRHKFIRKFTQQLSERQRIRKSIHKDFLTTMYRSWLL